MTKIGKGVRPEDLEPATGRTRGSPGKYPLGQLEAGEHFTVPLENRNDATRRKKVQAVQRAIRRFCTQQHPERVFAVRYNPTDNALYVIRTEDEPE